MDVWRDAVGTDVRLSERLSEPLPHLSSGPAPARVHVDGHDELVLGDGWQAAACSPDAHTDPAALDDLEWLDARVPGTAAAVLYDAGRLNPGALGGLNGIDGRDGLSGLDAEDWWWRTSFAAAPVAAGEEVCLCLDGIATVAEVYLNGERVLESDSMFAAHTLDVTQRLQEHNELAIRCRALDPLLGVRRRPRARWRTRLVADGGLRFYRTMLLGRLPGIAPGPAAVGPWRAVRLVRRRRLDVHELTLRPRLEGDDGVLSVRARVRPLDGQEIDAIEVELTGPSGSHRAQLAIETIHAGDQTTDDLGEPANGSGAAGREDEKSANGPGAGHLTAHGELRVPGVARWWPHTHGEPVLHDVCLAVHGVGGQSSAGGERDAHGERNPREPIAIDAGRVGFRDLAVGAGPEHDIERDGLDLHVNGVRVFARGAVWTPIDPIGLAPSDEELRAELTRVREAGMNMVRLPGTGAYETAAFHDLCDELGILVWQDLMFANLDYPIADERFRASVVRETTEALAALTGRPSLAIVCGNSEVEQQAAMMGLDSALGRGELFGELLPALVAQSGADAPYIPSAPYGGDLPFRPDAGIGTYYGVGCYRQPLTDARRARVRFAAECLAFSHVPCAETIEAMLPAAPERLAGNHPLWKAGVPRENEADWDFEDIRDHYLRELYGVDAADLRHIDRARYLELSRALTGEILAEVFGEWRRAQSGCGGGLVLWLHDLLPGAGWGLIDHRGIAKLAYHHLARALAPVAVWTVDEQLNGVLAHVANDGPQPLRARLRVTLYREGERAVSEGTVPVELEPHTQAEWNVESAIGRFVDAGWAYKFGPPALDAIVVTLARDAGEDEDAHAGEGASDGANEPQAAQASDGTNEGKHAGGGEGIIAQAFRFPAGRPLERESLDRLGLTAEARPAADGSVRLAISSRRLAYGVEIHAPGWTPSDDGFSIEPGGERVVVLRPRKSGTAFAGCKLTALNLQGRVSVGGADSSA